MKNDAELFEQMRAVLKPKGSLDVVRISYEAFTPTDVITECIDTLELRGRMASIAIKLGDEPKPLNALERLALLVLAESALIRL